jgi:hypothetical protein
MTTWPMGILGCHYKFYLTQSITMQMCEGEIIVYLIASSISWICVYNIK